jgi:hypothetical protein
MARIEDYPIYVEKIIKQYGQYKPAYGDIEIQMVFDKENHHYQLLNVGWDKNERIRGCVLHIDIKEGKIWIQHDGTEIGIANELVEMGVPKQDIVLAFHAPYKRQYTGFATN